MSRNAILVPVLLLVIVTSLFFVFRSRLDPASEALPDDQSWFWDPLEQRAFRGSAQLNPPVTSPWGNPSPMVIFFSCGDCRDRFPGYFISFTAEQKAALDADPNSGGAALGPGHPGRMYSTDASTWIVANSLDAANDAANLTGPGSELATRCPGRLQTCR